MISPYALLGGVLAGVTAGILTILLTQPSWVFRMLANRWPDVIFHIPTEKPILALTIDDGPDPRTTPMILAALRRHGARATFFLVSDRVPGKEDLVDQILQEGHEIGNHLKHVVPSISLPADEFDRTLSEAHGVLTPFGPLRWFRPGSGRFNRRMLSAIRKFGYQCALGSIYPYDAQVASVRYSRWLILKNLAPGAIIILHDYGPQGVRTAALLEEILGEITRLGYQTLTLTELAYEEGPNVDTFTVFGSH